MQQNLQQGGAVKLSKKPISALTHKQKIHKTDAQNTHIRKIPHHPKLFHWHRVRVCGSPGTSPPEHPLSSPPAPSLNRERILVNSGV